MPLRTLLGYEPRSVSRQDYGGRFVSMTPARGVMATKKNRYQAPMARVQKLPPIDEEGSGGRLSVPRRRQQALIHRVPRNVFGGDDDDDDGEKFFSRPSPMKSIPVVPVQPMRRVKTPTTPPETPKPKKEVFKMQMTSHLTPKDVNHTLVDGLVADYLHYSRYGHVIPVYEGSSVTTCPCCTDRNRQNVRTLLGFPKNVADNTPALAPTRYDKKANVNVPTKYDDKSRIKQEEELQGDGTVFPNSMYAHLRRKRIQRKEPTPEETRRKELAQRSHRQTWMNYQPLPYATNYLNPEFNRPSEVNALYESDIRNRNNATKYQVLEADTNYDTAMSKLGTYSRY
ncbi:uncharacterized protein LOC128213263 [Mya arenaria]|uniref:uncharacterized protein LOC128213263 n=1 Tax=Mya arenaria TaxID=6604 RepID=UPI0022E254C8|nr:uncharacterized protein LOC128213263 [Mya arenaria]XP_052774809.1 uncharacterized protein LOC128213263 [Mya arenaria]